MRKQSLPLGCAKAAVAPLGSPAPKFEQASAFHNADEESHVIRRLGTDASSGTTRASTGARAGTGTPPPEIALKSLPSEATAGLRMDSIDDEWDVEPPAQTDAAKDAAQPSAVSGSSTAGATPSPNPTGSGAGRFASPLGLSFPVATKTSVPPAATQAVEQAVHDKPGAPADPHLAVSKVQLAAEAFRQRSAAKTQKPVAQPVASADSAGAIAPSPMIVVSTMVSIEDPPELKEASSNAPPEQPGAVAAGASSVVPQQESLPAEQGSGAPAFPRPAEPPKADVVEPQPSIATVEAPADPATRHSDGHLSLDAGYAGEFFSSAPPPAHLDVEMDQDLLHELQRTRTPDQVARQIYLRRLVLRLMIGVLLFVLASVFVFWRRGMLRLP